jgi:hypothetical protein
MLLLTECRRSRRDTMLAFVGVDFEVQVGRTV